MYEDEAQSQVWRSCDSCPHQSVFWQRAGGEVVVSLVKGGRICRAWEEKTWEDSFPQKQQMKEDFMGMGVCVFS